MASRPLSPPHGLIKRPVVFEAQCTHLSMTRVYDPDAVCLHCYRRSPFGWMYQCTQDREEALEQAAARGELTAFDDLGRVLGTQLRIRKRSPAARQGRLSFFSEVTPEQMSSYRPEHIATILRQRENVLVQAETPFQPPWAPPSPVEECRYWVCPSCRPSAADRAYLSIDGVAGGEITPTAAVGYGFHVMGERPVVNANVVKTIGCRPVPKRNTINTSGSSSTVSDFGVMELLDQQIAQVYTNRIGPLRCPPALRTNSSHHAAKPMLTQPNHPSVGRLKHSPRCDNLTKFPELVVAASSAPTWPFERSPRNVPFSSPARGRGRMRPPPSNRSQASHPMPHAPSAFLPSRSASATVRPGSYPAQAVATPYRINEPSTSHGVEWGNDKEDSTEEKENQLAKADEQKFEPEPLKIVQGIAVLEESVELGVPDVITQA